jgi:hypothetical protein
VSTKWQSVSPKIDQLWAELDYEVTWLHGRWLIYRQLFGTDEERVDILNRSAGTFAYLLQNLLLHDVQLGLANIGDPPQTGRFKNLTVTALVNLVCAQEATLEPTLRMHLDKYGVACEKIRKRRNKWIAHFDHDTLVNRHAAPPAGPSREEIELALLALRELMNAVQLHFNKSQTAYELIILEADGEHLIAMLKRGIRYQQLVKSGKISANDLADNWSL